MEMYRATFSAMSCRNEILLHASSAQEAQDCFDAVIGEVHRIEALWSRYRDDSIVSRINRFAGHAPVRVDDETAAMLDYAATAWKTSGGDFDITSGVLRRVWRFDTQDLPTSDAIDGLLPLIGWEKVEWAPPTLYLTQTGMEIDFGGLGKEYAADRAAALIAQRGLPGLVNLGGDMVATAAPPDDLPWKIGIRDPAQGNEQSAAYLALWSGALATSGTRERCMEVNGRRYSHILKPSTGWPVEDAPDSVTVLASTCLVAGTLATLALLKGADAEDWLASANVQHHVIRG